MRWLSLQQAAWQLLSSPIWWQVHCCLWKQEHKTWGVLHLLWKAGQWQWACSSLCNLLLLKRKHGHLHPSCWQLIWAYLACTDRDPHPHALVLWAHYSLTQGQALVLLCCACVLDVLVQPPMNNWLPFWTNARQVAACTHSNLARWLKWQCTLYLQGILAGAHHPFFQDMLQALQLQCWAGSILCTA